MEAGIAPVQRRGISAFLKRRIGNSKLEHFKNPVEAYAIAGGAGAITIEHGKACVLNVLRLWGVVLAANLLGCLAAAWVASRESAFAENVRLEFATISEAAMEGSFGAHVMRGIFAGWLIALMVWVLPFTESARFWVIIVLSYVVGLGHFSHVVAGAVQTFYGAVIGNASWLTVCANYLLPTFIGNVIGGVALVAAINHAQVVSGKGSAHI